MVHMHVVAEAMQGNPTLKISVTQTSVVVNILALFCTYFISLSIVELDVPIFVPAFIPILYLFCNFNVRVPNRYFLTHSLR